MNLDITFPNTPCYLIDIDVANSIQVNSVEASKQELIKRRLDKNGDLVSSSEPDPNDPQTYINILQEALVAGEQCNIKGKIHLYRVTGKVLFSFNSKLYYVEELRRRFPE